MRLHETGWRVRNLRGALVNTLLAAAVLLAAAPADAQETLYFADIFNLSFSDGYLRKVNTDGSGLQTLVNTGGGLRGVAVDRFAGKVYWTDVDDDAIRRANLDGSGAEDLLNAGVLVWVADRVAVRPKRVVSVAEASHRRPARLHSGLPFALPKLSCLWGDPTLLRNLLSVIPQQCGQIC